MMVALLLVPQIYVSASGDRASLGPQIFGSKSMKAKCRSSIRIFWSIQSMSSPFESFMAIRTTNFEILQELSDGTFRRRDRPLSEKMKPNKGYKSVAIRAVAEELGSVERCRSDSSVARDSTITLISEKRQRERERERERERDVKKLLFFDIYLEILYHVSQNKNLFNWVSGLKTKNSTYQLYWYVINI